MRLRPVAIAASLAAALAAIPLLAGSAAAHTRPGHLAHTHHRRGHRLTVQPSATVPRSGGGVLQNPVWGHQGNLPTLRPRTSLAMRPAGALRPHSVVPPGNGPGGEDPIQSECWDANAYIANTAPLPYPNGEWGYIANWYSPDCGTNWAETVVTNDPGFLDEVLEADIYDDVTGENYMFQSNVNGTYTNMTDSPTTTACATGGLIAPNDHTGFEAGTACA